MFDAHIRSKLELPSLHMMPTSWTQSFHQQTYSCISCPSAHDVARMTIQACPREVHQSLCTMMMKALTGLDDDFLM